jgi:hypothetical protein
VVTPSPFVKMSVLLVKFLDASYMFNVRDNSIVAM